MLAAGVSEERWNSLDSDVREFLADIAYVGRPLQGRRGEYAAEILNNESLNTAGQLVAMHSLNRVIRTSNTLNSQGQPTGRQFSGQRGYEVRRHWLNARIREHAEPSATGGGLTPEVMNAAREQIQSIRSQENAARTSNPSLGPIIPSP